MKVEKNKVVVMHYTLTLETGELVDTTHGGEPLEYQAGAGNIIPGLDAALMGLSVGDEKKISVPPAEGYGEFDQDLVQVLPRDMFVGIDNIQVGMEFQTQTDQGDAQFVIVTKVEDDNITIDANHEFAGKVLNFDVKIENILEVSEE